MRVIRDNKELQGVKRVYEGFKGFTREYQWLLRGVTAGWRGLLLVVTGLLGITGWFYLFWNYSLLFYILFTKRFIFSFYWKQLLKIDKILISQLWYTRWWNNCQMREFKEHSIHCSLMKLLTKQFCLSGSLKSWIKTQNIQHLHYWRWQRLLTHEGLCPAVFLWHLIWKQKFQIFNKAHQLFSEQTNFPLHSNLVLQMPAYSLVCPWGKKALTLSLNSTCSIQTTC